jgi:hypothetical protein
MSNYTCNDYDIGDYTTNNNDRSNNRNFICFAVIVASFFT